MEKIIISCLESRIETNKSIYARFLLGPFKDDNAVTIATALRRSLLSKVKGIAITAIHIQGVNHEFSTIVGVRESVLDLAFNLQQVVLRIKTDKRVKKVSRQSVELKKRDFKVSTFGNRDWENQIKSPKIRSENTLPYSENVVSHVNFQTAQIGYLQMRGPAVIYANDLQLPMGIECVDPTQYIATLSTEGLLVVKFLIGDKKASVELNYDVLIGQKLPYLPKRSFEPGYQNDILESEASSSSLVEQTSETTKFRYRGIDREKLASLQLGDISFKIGGQGFIENISNKERVVLNHRSRKDSDKKKASIPNQNKVLTVPFKSFDPTICLRNTIFLDPIFDSVFQANYVIEKDDLFNQPRERIVLEFWTNGSIHPRQALHKASLSLISTFSLFRKVFHLDSL